jgi:hypothetical protein
MTSIPEYFADACSTLKSISVPDGIKSIGDYAFWRCPALQSVSLPETLKTIGKSAFRESAITGITLPEPLTTIGDFAFDNCANLEAIEIPANVTTIGSCAFSYCPKLANVISYPVTPPAISVNTFNHIADDAKLYVPAGSLSLYKSSSYKWKDSFSTSNIIAL